jgi:hypothetical protein
LAVELTKLAERGEIILHDQFFEDISAREQVGDQKLRC